MRKTAATDLDRRILGQRYSYHHRGAMCFYCGELAGTVDHCPPIAWADVFDIKSENCPPFVLVNACSDCNTRLGARQFFTLQARAAYLLARFHVEYDRKSVLWSAEEIAELGYSLRVIVEYKQKLLYMLVMRIRHCESLLIDELRFEISTRLAKPAELESSAALKGRTKSMAPDSKPYKRKPRVDVMQSFDPRTIFEYLFTGDTEIAELYTPDVTLFLTAVENGYTRYDRRFSTNVIE